MWPNTLSGRLPIIALVGRYPANKLIGASPLPGLVASKGPTTLTPVPVGTVVSSGFTTRFQELSRSRGYVN